MRSLRKRLEEKRSKQHESDLRQPQGERHTASESVEAVRYPLENYKKELVNVDQFTETHQKTQENEKAVLKSAIEAERENNATLALKMKLLQNDKVPFSYEIKSFKADLKSERNTSGKLRDELASTKNILTKSTSDLEKSENEKAALQFQMKQKSSEFAANMEYFKKNYEIISIKTSKSQAQLALEQNERQPFNHSSRPSTKTHSS